MACQKTLEYLVQQSGRKASLFEGFECQIQARHVNTTCFTIVQTHTSVDSGAEALAFKQNGQSNPTHAYPVEGQCQACRLGGDIRESKSIHG